MYNINLKFDFLCLNNFKKKIIVLVLLYGFNMFWNSLRYVMIFGFFDDFVILFIFFW